MNSSVEERRRGKKKKKETFQSVFSFARQNEWMRDHHSHYMQFWTTICFSFNGIFDSMFTDVGVWRHDDSHYSSRVFEMAWNVFKSSFKETSSFESFTRTEIQENIWGQRIWIVFFSSSSRVSVLESFAATVISLMTLSLPWAVCVIKVIIKRV